MKSINDHFEEMISSAIYESKWFRTAPKDLQKKAKIKVLGVDWRPYRSIIGGSVMRPAFIAECECGGEKQRFSMLLDGENPVDFIEVEVEDED